MHETARRRDQGRPLRAAMDAAGVGLQQLADRVGVSFQLVAFLATDRDWARQTTSVTTAHAIEDALSAPRGSLFAVDVIYARRDRAAWADL